MCECACDCWILVLAEGWNNHNDILLIYWQSYWYIIDILISFDRQQHRAGGGTLLSTLNIESCLTARLFSSFRHNYIWEHNHEFLEVHFLFFKTFTNTYMIHIKNTAFFYPLAAYDITILQSISQIVFECIHKFDLEEYCALNIERYLVGSLFLSPRHT